MDEMISMIIAFVVGIALGDYILGGAFVSIRRQ